MLQTISSMAIQDIAVEEMTRFMAVASGGTVELYEMKVQAGSMQFS